jgi:hypothetical protein
MSTVFLFGAGASYGSGECYPENPPLGFQLFDELQRWGGVASTVDEPLRRAFKEDFEEGMEDFFRARNQDITRFLREMADYFAQFEPGPKNYYGQLAKIAAQAKGSVVFATTNYEALIELAVSQAGYKFAYGEPAHYPKGGIPILKLHGSCNFLPDLRNISLRDVSFNLTPEPSTPIEQLSASIFDGPVKPAFSLTEVRAFCKKQDSAAPALGLYLPGKHVMWCRSFVERQQELWYKAVKRAGRIYVIGAAVYDHDNHIWDVLADVKGQLRYVDPKPEPFLEWCDKQGRKSASVIPDNFEEALPTLRRQMKDR